MKPKTYIPDQTKSWPLQIAKFYYITGQGKDCRKTIIKYRILTLKSMAMFITSYFPFVVSYIIKKSDILLTKSGYRPNIVPKEVPCVKFKKIKDKINLSDVSFIMAAQYDHPERVENFELTLAYLKRYFTTNFLIGEINTNIFEFLKADNVKYYQLDKIGGFTKLSGEFHRPRLFNWLIKLAKTEINFIWDSDILINPANIKKAAHLLRLGHSYVYPHNNKLYRVPREYFPVIRKTLSLKSLTMPVPVWKADFGGAFGFRKSDYMKIGWENENLVGYVPDDTERLERIARIGGGYLTVGEELFHMEHFRGPDSRLGNKNMINNYNEIFKTKAMNDDQLRDYVNSWAWIKEYKDEIQYNS